MATESSLVICGGGAACDKGSCELAIVPELGPAAALDFAVLGSLLFMVVEGGNEVPMGEDSGMETSWRRPPCEPAPVGVLLLASRTLISTAAAGCGCVGVDPVEMEGVGACEVVDADVPVPCPAPVVDCAAASSAIGRLSRGLQGRIGCRFWGWGEMWMWMWMWIGSTPPRLLTADVMRCRTNRAGQLSQIRGK